MTEEQTTLLVSYIDSSVNLTRKSIFEDDFWQLFQYNREMKKKLLTPQETKTNG